MEKTQGKLKATLIGRLETPMITTKPLIKKNGCWVRVVRDHNKDNYPILTTISKLVKGERRTPTIFRGYKGYVKVSCVGYNKEKLLSKLNDFLMKGFLGSYTSDGYGRVKWFECQVSDFQQSKMPFKKKFKIRKGLGTNYPDELQRLLIALMLHDFIDNELHPSKIYQSITIEDEEIREACVNHHNGEESTNKLLPLVKHYDKLASIKLRKKQVSVAHRYNSDKGKINLPRLAKDIEQNQHSAYKLYSYIYQSNDLGRIVESMRYGQNNLRYHLLSMVNLAINDYYNNVLKIKNNIISLSTSEREELTTVKDAEMHTASSMNNADSES